jgi:alpha-glutamyl/putrescinyl thymine pyrophosphorylase clade 1
VNFTGDKMLIDYVKKLSLWDRLWYWIDERECIRIQKQVGEPKPWTNDPILQQFKFTNVRRMDDKVSQWLLNNWYKPYYGHPKMLLACAIARFINRPDSLTQITELVFETKQGIPFERIVTKLRKYRDAGNAVFNGAYMVRGNDGVDKIDSVINRNVKPLLQYMHEVDPTSMERSWQAILPSYGMGSFMGGQIIADLRWAMDGRWGDRRIWAPVGPGSRRGMSRLLGIPIKGKRAIESMSQEEFIPQLRRLIGLGVGILPSSITNRLEAIDWQSCLCEYDKYSRALEGTGKPKQIYPGAK